jgi:hypothetical protein
MASERVVDVARVGDPERFDLRGPAEDGNPSVAEDLPQSSRQDRLASLG